MLLQIYPNGRGDGHATHLCVFVVLLGHISDRNRYLARPINLQLILRNIISEHHMCYRLTLRNDICSPENASEFDREFALNDINALNFDFS